MYTHVYADPRHPSTLEMLLRLAQGSAADDKKEAVGGHGAWGAGGGPRWVGARIPLECNVMAQRVSCKGRTTISTYWLFIVFTRNRIV